MTPPLVMPDTGLRCPTCGAAPAPGSALCLGCQDAAVARVRRVVAHAQRRQRRMDRARAIFHDDLARFVPEISQDAREQIIRVMADCFLVGVEDAV